MEVHVLLHRLLAECRRVVGEDGGGTLAGGVQTRSNYRHTCIHGHCLKLQACVQSLTLEGIVGGESAFLSCEAQIAVRLYRRRVESGLPDAHFIHCSGKDAVVGESLGNVVAGAARANYEGVGGESAYVCSRRRDGTLAVYIDSGVAGAQHIECHMVPGVIENGGGGTAQRLVGSRERELSGGSAGQGGSAHLQQAGFTLLHIGLHPQFYGIVVVHGGGYMTRRNEERSRAVKFHREAGTVDKPCRSRQREMATACEVGSHGAFALVHGPVAYEVRSGCQLRALAFGLCLCHAVRLVPEREFVHGTTHVLAYGESAACRIGHHGKVGEQFHNISVVSYACIQYAAVVSGLVAQAQISPLAHRKFLV